MDSDLKKTLKAVTLELRHLLEGRYESDGEWKPGDLEQRLAAIGVRRDKASVPVDELGHLPEEDLQARKVVDAYLKLREEAGVARSDAVAEFVRETAYTWANRLLALRCMESRELIDSVILQEEAYGGRSLEHHRLAQRNPELCIGDDDGLFAVLNKVFREQTHRLPMLFDPQAPGIALRPAPVALKDCFGLLSLNPDTLRKYRIRLKNDEAANGDTGPPNPFTAPDALGWAYQYWNTEEKERVFEKVRMVKGAKIAGADIIPATQLYTEDYMVKFLVQNSLGATWMGMHPESKLAETWEYYVKDADRAPEENKPVGEITFLDPACGSGHFLLEAFDLYYEMYKEEGELTKPREICDSILTKNLFGIDIDARAVQIAEVALWMKAAEREFDYKGVPTNLVAATASHLRGESWEEFLAGFQREPSVARVLRKFAKTMEHIDEIGSLARPAEDLREIIKEEHSTWERQVRTKREANYLFAEMNEEALSGQLPFHEISDEEFGDRLFYRAKAGIDAFTELARASGAFEDQLLGSETRTGFRLVDLLGRHYDVVAANPPYMGSKNMGPMLKAYIERQYTPGKRDLYAAFIVRSMELLEPCGMGAIVSMNKWLHARAYAPLRCGRALSASGEEKGPRDPRNILNSSKLRYIVDLGSRAFDAENKFHDGVQVVLFVLLRCPPNAAHRVMLFDCRSPDGPFAKQEHLLLLRRDQRFQSVAQAKFAALPGSPLISGLSDAILERLKESPPFGDIARVRQGICTTNDPRFVRMVWETADRSRWITFAKAGGRRRWDGLRYYAIDWQHDGRRIKEFITDTPHAIHWSGRMPERNYFFKEGWGYSRIAYGSLGLRRFRASDLFSDTNPILLFDSALGNEGAIGYGGLLNSPLTTFLLRAFTQSNDFREGYLRRMPYVRADAEILTIASQLTKEALIHAERVSSMDPTESGFVGITEARASIQEIAAMRCRGKLDSELMVAVCEALLGLLVEEQWQLPESDRQHIRAQMGILKVSTKDETAIPEPVRSLLKKVTNLISPTPETSHDILYGYHIVEMAAQYVDSGIVVEDAEYETILNSVDEEDDDDVAVSSPVPPYGDVDRFARLADLDIVSAYRGLTQLIEERGPWKNQFTDIVADLCTDRICRLLGHRWPKQIKGGEPVPDWADPDGIIPLTPLANEVTLFERVQQRLRTEEINAGAFTEVMGKSLDVWLSTEFFKHHTKQFKKRPIAWQLQSGKFTARRSPVFACLLYYHKLDADTLPKIRSQYVGPLRQRLETELRSIQSVAVEARSDRQENRRVVLDDAIRELTEFDKKLEEVSKTGFEAPGLQKLLEHEPLDRWCSLDGKRPHPTTTEDLIAQESTYTPDINDGVRVNIAPLQKAGLLAADVLAKKDVDKAIADRAQWRADERRWVRESKLPQPGWWPENGEK